MPRDDKTLKPRKGTICKTGKEEKQALKALGHVPKFPAKLIGIKNHRKSS